MECQISRIHFKQTSDYFSLVFQFASFTFNCDIEAGPVEIYLFNNETIEQGVKSGQSHWSRSDVFITNFGQISQLVLVILLLTLERKILIWWFYYFFFLLLLELVTCNMWFCNLHLPFVGSSLHNKWSFPLRITPVNVTKFAVFCGFGHIYWINL